jgi:hypothetical protein
MDHAEDRRGKIIKARTASPGPFYHCPVCRAEVFLKSGKYNVRHFAHKAGQGRAECEHFHPSDYVRGAWLSLQRFGEDSEGPPIPPLALSIELDPTMEARLKGLRKWKLALTVPKAPDTHGLISIDCGAGAPRQIALTKLALGPQTYPASVNATDFGQVWISHEVRPRYRAAIEQRIPGLQRNLVNVFANTRQKQKPLANSLAWGGSYYLISCNAFEIDIPKAIPSSLLAAEGEWECSLINLPDEEDESVRLWIEEVCHLTVARTTRSWAMIYPPVLDIDSLGGFSVSSTARILFAIYSPADQTGDHDAISCAVGASSASIPNGPGKHLFEVRHDSRPDARVALNGDGYDFPEVAKASLDDNPLETVGVAFTFRSRMDADRYSAFLHHRLFDQLLRRARARDLELVAITPPPGVKGLFASRNRSDGDWRKIALSSASTIQDALSQINALLNNVSADICIDFGAFGRAVFASGKSEFCSGASLQIPQLLRNRIIWFCSAVKSFPVSKTRGVLSDEALVKHLECLPTPVHLTAHRRHIDRLIAEAQAVGRGA